MKGSFALRGNICHTPGPEALEIRENAFAVCEEEVVVGLPAEFFKPAAGREGAECVAHVRGDRFVERHPQRNFIFERLE